MSVKYCQLTSCSIIMIQTLYENAFIILICPAHQSKWETTGMCVREE